MMQKSVESIAISIIQQISGDLAWHYRLVPFGSENGSLSCWVDESVFSEDIREEMELVLGKSLRLVPVDSKEIQQLLGIYYRKGKESKGEMATPTFSNKEDNFIEELIKEAKNLESSDIHFEPYEHKCRVRFRIDGKLIEKYQFDKEAFPAIVNKVKIKANLDIAEKRLPQDGRIFFKLGESQFDIRVSTLPTLHGEKIVMRLLSSDQSAIDIQQLGLSGKNLTNYMEGVHRPSGIVLISGPTGSGKTTTLYATLQALNQTERNILTIEDPIEYTLEGINQVQLKEAIGLDFASAMRTFLRQDPDIIMVGEIRDVVTASMAIRASLTGHLVLSTIHTNSAWGIVSRLIDMGIAPYLLADTLNTAVAQRLIRLLCPHCKEKSQFDENLYPRQFKTDENIREHYLSQGCENCHFTGYKGRLAVYEVIPINAILSEKIKNVDLNINTLIKEMNIGRLPDNAFALFRSGQTSLKEVYPILATA